MSSVENNSSGRMNSITRRLCSVFARQMGGRILLSTVLLFAAACGGWLALQEYLAFGSIQWNAGRSFFTESTIGGKITEIFYRVVHSQGAPVEIAVGQAFLVICIVFAALLVFRLLSLFLGAVPKYGRRVRDILEPLNQLALKADQLSRLEFGEDKYHLLEDAIANLDADESSRLSLGDSELLGIEAAINNLLTRIREANRQQARFVNDASHELRTPLAVIGGYADMLERWGKNDEKILNESINAIQTETARMSHLVEQLLFLARGDSGKTRLNKEEIKLAGLMREAYEESVMIDERHVYRFRQDGEPCVSADAGLLKQAVRILIDNAAKYTKEGDEIILSCGVEEGRPYLQVQDCGIGMAESDARHMFERFYRADKARSFDGTGLGLSIAKWIVDKHQGHFEVLSRQDIGTRIRIVL
ncbi:MAG: HAMP domain-containing histidine kinase [Firmicutes bacterium]|nr:HAMP domain-containing histidine kinase [Bacillota bacterium]